MSKNKNENFALTKDHNHGFYEEIAKINNIEGFISIINKLPNPDSVLRKTGKGYDTLRLLTQEGQIATCIQSRKSATLALKYRINLPEANDERQNFYENILKKIDLYNLISDILNAPLFGYQPIEIIWQCVDGFVVPVKIQAKPQEWFFFDIESKLRIKLKKHTDGVVIESSARKFLCPQHNADYLNPYGLALLSLCFWDVAFKKGGMQFWMKFIEKYAIPYFIGKYEPGTSDEEKEEILQLLERMVQDAVGVIPNNAAVEIKESAGKGTSAAIFKTFIEVMDRNISKNILGQTLTTEPGESGSYSLGKVHNQVRQDIIESDIRLTETTINRLLLWIHEINFNDNNCPSIELYSPKNVTTEEANIDKTAYDMGVRFSANHFVRKYGYKADEITVVQTDKFTDATNDFSEADNAYSLQKDFDRFVEDFSDAELNDIFNEKLKPVIQNFSNCRNTEEAMDMLSEIYPQMNSKQLEEKLTKVIFISDLLGRISVKKGS